MKVTVRDLEKSFPTPAEPLVVLRDLDLEIDSGAALAVTGPSGCGKSTLLHILGTLDRPTAGSVRLGETDPFALPEKQLARFRNRSIGFVFQDHYLLPQLSVLENVLVPSFVSDASRDEIEARAVDLLERIGLADRRGHRPAELSGGERQRASIARALILRPGLLLCDEPTGNLDLRTAEKVSDVFIDLCKASSTTLVTVTHSSELAARFDRRLALETLGAGAA